VSTTAYIAIAWISTIGVVAGYAFAVIRRGRALSRSVPPERRRWM
jgi:hypothetical protein